MQQREQMLLRLGEGQEGSMRRAELMRSSLLSDMEAFKAANPGCSLGDFVRWYSPKDWGEEGLSLRWVELMGRDKCYVVYAHANCQQAIKRPHARICFELDTQRLHSPLLEKH